MIINIDIFFIQLVKSVCGWYDNVYMDIDNRKFVHIDTLATHYMPERFRNTKDLNRERNKFLGEVQVIVERDLDNAVSF